jgi:hypothetical protein
MNERSNVNIEKNFGLLIEKKLCLFLDFIERTAKKHTNTLEYVFGFPFIFPYLRLRGCRGDQSEFSNLKNTLNILKKLFTLVFDILTLSITLSDIRYACRFHCKGREN